MFIHDFLKDYTCSFRIVVIEKLLGNYLLKDVVPEYFQDVNRLKQRQVITINLKSSLSNHLNGQKIKPIVMAKDIVCVLASSKTCNIGQVARVLGVDRKNIKKVVERQCIIDTNEDFG
jgi:hypothetical protein